MKDPWPPGKGRERYEWRYTHSHLSSYQRQVLCHLILVQIVWEIYWGVLENAVYGDSQYIITDEKWKEI